MLPPLIAWGLLATAMSPLDALQGVSGSWRHVLAGGVLDQHFYRLGMGTDAPLANIKILVAIAAYFAIFLLPAALVAMRMGHRRRAGTVAAWIMFVVAIGVAGGLWNIMPWMMAARPLPLFMLALGAILTILFLRKRREAPEAARWVLQIAFIIFALMLLSKMVLNTRVYHYGFVLAMPASLILMAALLNWIPCGLTRLGGCGVVFRNTVLGGAIIVVLTYVNVVAQNMATKAHPVASGADSFRADRRAGRVNWAVREVRQRLQPDQTLAVVPECVMVNYLARRTNPTQYHRFDPLVIALYGEREMLQSLQSHPPDFVLVVHTDYDEFGLRFFGTDYGRLIFEWIESNYSEVSSYGARPLRDEQFGMRLLRWRVGDEHR